MKKKPITPRSRIVQSLRQLWLRSRERAAALKRDNYTCQVCRRKQSTAKGKEFKVTVHHLKGIDNWSIVVDKIRETILCSPDYLQTLCIKCHDDETKMSLKKDTIKTKSL